MWNDHAVHITNPTTVRAASPLGLILLVPILTEPPVKKVQKEEP